LHLYKIMKIYFWSVGKAHESYVKEGVEVFTKRISHYYPVEWKIFPSSKSTSEDHVKKNETTQLLNAIQNDDIVVALDENGKQWNSIELAEFIQQRANTSTKNLIFIIGGAYGLQESILKRCNYKWSLSKLVFPHQLVRIILSEQVYRACTILRNEKYHHS
jgi:23S rRNA (pseudouridine1915-N3)-methyltransferase